MTRNTATWMARAYRSALGATDFPPEVLEREEEDLRALEDLGVRVLTPDDHEFPARLRRDGGPLVLQVAGRTALLEEDGVEVVAGHRRLGELLDRGDRAVVVLSKGLLKARTLLRALHEPLADGAVALVSAEPPRAAWGPVRDRRRDALCRALART